jgi:hypothetical protein
VRCLGEFTSSPPVLTHPLPFFSLDASSSTWVIVCHRNDNQRHTMAKSLSEKPGSAVSSHAADKVEHTQVVVGLFAPASQDAAEAVEPAVSALHDPAPSLLGRLFLLGFFAARADVGDKAMGLENGAHFVVVIALVQADVLRATGGRLWLFDGDALEGFCEQLEVVAVGSCHRQTDGYAASLHEQ